MLRKFIKRMQSKVHGRAAPFQNAIWHHDTVLTKEIEFTVLFAGCTCFEMRSRKTYIRIVESNCTCIF